MNAKRTIIKISEGIIAISAFAGIGAFLEERRNEARIATKQKMGIYEQYFKRPLDCTLATGALILVSPILGTIALLVKGNLGSPVFYTQERAGKSEKPFYIIKFRSMTDERDEQGRLLPDDKRLTRLGHVLRSTSMDELPELINIIKGEMAIVGPRPLPVRYSRYYRDDEKKRFLVRGGLVPPDSVDTNPIISWDKQLQYEKDYAQNVTLINDLKIIVSAVRIIFERNNNDYGAVVRKALSDERQKMNDL